jgi:hypothetical protein
MIFFRWYRRSYLSVRLRVQAAIADLIEKLQGHPIWAFLIAPEQNMPKIVLNGSKQKKIVGFKGALENKQIKVLIATRQYRHSFRHLRLTLFVSGCRRNYAWSGPSACLLPNGKRIRHPSLDGLLTTIC